MKPTLRDEILGWEQTLNAEYDSDHLHDYYLADLAVTAIPALVAALRERGPQTQAHWDILFRAQERWPDAHDRESLTVEMLRFPRGNAVT